MKYTSCTCAGLNLMFGGQIYPNNSVFLMTEIGEASMALLCVTNNTNCCQSNRMGEWFYPNNTQVPTSGARLNFYRNRDSQVVRLNRRNNALSPTGKYHCEVVDASGTSQTLTANIIGKLYSHCIVNVLHYSIDTVESEGNCPTPPTTTCPPLPVCTTPEPVTTPQSPPLGTCPTTECMSACTEARTESLLQW